MTQGELVDKLSRRWRMLGMEGGGVSAGVGLVGYLGSDERVGLGCDDVLDI